MASTYTPIATTTLSSTTSTYTFSSIPATYTDLVLIVTGTLASGTGTASLDFRVNGDTGTNYSDTHLDGSSSATSDRDTNFNWMNLGLCNSSTVCVNVLQVFNYANTTTYKTFLCRGNHPASYVRASVGLWRSTSAINSITVGNNGAISLASGMTLTLYGIKAA